MSETHVPPDGLSEHLTARQVATFLDGDLRGPEREAVAAHCVACGECRRELVEVRGTLIATVSPRRWRSVAIAAGVAAVLTLAIISPVVDRANDNGRPSPGTTRSAIDRPRLDAKQGIAIVAPTDGAVLSGARGTLLWRGAGPGAMYLLTVQDTAGNVMFSATGPDTTVMVPSSARLVRGQRYFWSVDARLADGHTSQTGVHSFTVR